MHADELTPYTEFAVHVAPNVAGGTDVAIMGELDLATLDPPGMNKGVPRFGKTDF